jgi:hypothetical protein
VICQYTPCSVEFTPRRSGHPQRFCCIKHRRRRVIETRAIICANPKCKCSFETTCKHRRFCRKACSNAMKVRVKVYTCDSCHQHFEPTKRQLSRCMVSGARPAIAAKFCASCVADGSAEKWRCKMRQMRERAPRKVCESVALALSGSLCGKCSIRKSAIESGDTQGFLSSCPLRKTPISDAELDQYASRLAIHIAHGAITREDAMSVT